jgi:hypothetical protein
VIPSLALVVLLAAPPADAGRARMSCFPKAAALDEFRYEWYCKHLQAMGERELAPGAESYRFLYLRSFDAPISVRVQRIGDSWLLSGRTLSGKGGYEPGSVVNRTERELSTEEVQALERRLRGADFWGDPWVNQEDTGVDGARWILEGRRGSEYRLLDIWSPEGIHYRLFRDICLYFLDLATVRPAEERIY